MKARGGPDKGQQAELASFVEACLTAMLVLAGVSAGDAVLATFAYRLFQYWLPLPFGLLGMALAPLAAAAEQP